jgi:glutaconate CoA-transferase subunit B
MGQNDQYSTVELMICTASRLLENNKSVLVGTGLPILAAMLAQKTHSPNLLIAFEAGGIGAEISGLPISVGDSRTFRRAVMAGSMDYVMSLAQSGYMDYCFLGAAQIDCFGNINTTVIGPHDRPITRLPGSGGANDAGSLCWRTIILMRQDKRKFVKKIDFLTTPGFLRGVEGRARIGLPLDTGPYRVVTQLGIMGFEQDSGRMILLSVHPGITVNHILSNTDFDLIIPKRVSVTLAPTTNELDILRNTIDPAGKISERR